MVWVERIEDPSRFASLHAEWDDLLAASRADCFFLTWDWLHTWWKHLAGHRRLHLLLVRSGGELIAIAPLAWRPPQPSRLLPFPTLEFLGTGTAGSDYLDVIVRRGREAEGVDALVGALNAPPMLEFAQVRRESSFAAEAALVLGRRGWRIRDAAIEPCPVIDLAGHSWESYLGSLGAAHRYNFRRRLRSLQRRFDVRLQRVANDAERREALEALVALHARRWRERGGSVVFASPALRSFHDDVSRLALERGQLRLFVLRLDNRPAAVLYGFRYGRVFYFYQSGFEPALGKESVGLVLMGLTIRSAIEEGAAEYDLLHGAEPYKFQWAHRVRELRRLELFAPDALGAICSSVAAMSSLVRRGGRALAGDALADRIVHRGWRGLLTPWARGS